MSSLLGTSFIGSISATEWAFGSSVLLVGASVQSIVGFGMNLIAVPVLLVAGYNEFVPGPLIVALVFQALTLGLGERHHAQWNLLRWFLPARLVGTFIGVELATQVNQSTATVVICSLVLLAVILSMSGVRVPSTRPAWITTGAASGFSNALSSIGGPPLALALANEPPPTQRATQGWSAMVGSVMSIVLLSCAGKFHSDDLALGLTLVPAALAGSYIVRPLRSRLPTSEALRPYVWGVAIVGSLAAIARALV
jgi:uncharacterized protein